MDGKGWAAPPDPGDAKLGRASTCNQIEIISSIFISVLGRPKRAGLAAALNCQTETLRCCDQVIIVTATPWIMALESSIGRAAETVGDSALRDTFCKGIAPLQWRRIVKPYVSHAKEFPAVFAFKQPTLFFGYFLPDPCGIHLPTLS